MTVHDEMVASSGWSIADVLRRIIWGHKTLVTGFVVLGAAGGLGWASSAPTTYHAGTELVTGTYSVPQEVGLDAALDGAGPLGIELPAETQVRILTSPAVVSLAVTELALDDDASLELLTTAAAQPITDNVFTVSAAGPTPQDAAERANAVAAAYLDYRQARATEKLGPLRDEALARAATAESAFADLQPRIASAQDAEDLALAAALVGQQEELDLISSRENALAGTIDAWLQSFGGGGTVVRPADAGDAVGGVPTSRTVAAGILAGLVLGIGAAFLLERVRSPLRTNEDVTDVVGVDIPVLPVRDDRTGVIAARTIWRHRTPTAGAPRGLAVIPAVEGRDVSKVAHALASGLESLGHPTSVDSRDVADDARQPGEALRTDDVSEVLDVPHGQHVRITEFVDVATLCLDVAAAAHTFDVIVTVTLDKDSTRGLTDTMDALSTTGFTVVAVMLRSRRNHRLSRLRLRRPRWHRRVPGPAGLGVLSIENPGDTDGDDASPTEVTGRAEAQMPRTSESTEPPVESVGGRAEEVAAPGRDGDQVVGEHEDSPRDEAENDETDQDGDDGPDTDRSDDETPGDGEADEDDETGSALVADTGRGRGGRRR